MRIAVLLFMAALACGPAAADGVGVVAAEVGCGFVGGAALGILAVPVGALANTDEFGGGGFIALIVAYPAGVGGGVWAAGEIWGDTEGREGAALAASLGAAYLTCGTGYAIGDWRGLFVGGLLAPLASTAAYNAVKNIGADDEYDFYVNASFCF